jgi:hypothetical protein
VVGISARALWSGSGGFSIGGSWWTAESWSVVESGEGVPVVCDPVEGEWPSTVSEFLCPWPLSSTVLWPCLLLKGLEQSFTTCPYSWHRLHRKGTPS